MLKYIKIKMYADDVNKYATADNTNEKRNNSKRSK